MVKKIEIKNVILSEDEDNILKIKGFEDEEIPFENLTDKIREMIKLEKPLNIKISKTRKGGTVERKPVFKYKCPTCGKEVKSTEESLVIQCVDCQIEYIKEGN